MHITTFDAHADEVAEDGGSVKNKVGARNLNVANSDYGGSFRVLVMYPTQSNPVPVELGPYSLDVAWDAPINQGAYPVVVISHGTGGTHFGYRTLASHLAANGYVVLMPEHPGNNRNNNELADSVENLIYRPQHIALAVDAVQGDPNFKASVTTSAYVIIGHSMGGYTALAVAGGNPSAGPGEPVGVKHDHRVAGLVLMAPATPWFQGDGALANVTVPILLFSGEKDDVTPLWHADIVKRGVPTDTEVEHRVIDNAGHFSFMSVFPASMQNPQFPPAQDPEGFGRADFQESLKADVLEFIRSTL